MSPSTKSSTETQDKDLMLDKDMEKDTWNFKSMTDDDPMDFGFDTQPKTNKKNAFKLDMGFDLDGDFGNFKMDMPDFDFSSPAKKTTKPKESSDDRSSGNVKQKKDLFSFAYDFNALDDFNLDSSPPKKQSETMDCEGTSAGRKFDKSDALDFDLDSSPPKKGSETKTKTKDCKENPAGRKFGKSDTLDFDLESSLPKKKSETKTKTMDCKESAAGRKFDKSDALDFDLDLPVTREAASKAKTEVNTNASAETENQISNTTDTMVVDSRATTESMENSEFVESPESPRLNSSKSHMMCLEPQSVNTSPSKPSSPMVEEIDELCPANETTAPSPLRASDIEHTVVNRETSPDTHEVFRSGTKEDSPSDPDQNAHDKMISITESSYEKTVLNISTQVCLDKIEHQQEEMSTDTHAKIRDQTRRTLCDQDAGDLSSGTRPSQTAKVQDSSAKLPLAPSRSVMDTDTQAETRDRARRTLRDPDAGRSQALFSGKVSPPTPSRQTFQIHDSNAKLPLASSHSVPGLGDLKVTQNKDSGLIRSRFFKKPEQPESHVLEPSTAQKESRPDARERKGLTLNSTNDRSSGIKEASPGSTTTRRPLEPVNTDSGKNVESVNTSSSLEKKIIHKDHSNAKTVEHVTGLLDRSKMQAKNTTRERSMLQINISSKLDASSLTQKLSKHLSSGAESLQKSKIVPLERPKLGNIMSDMRAAKIQRTIGVYKDQPSSAVQPEASSLINMEKITETPVKKSSEIHHFAPRDKTQILHCPSSLKRKALDEEADKSLTPQLKRFSMSPRENRNVEELTHRIAQDKFSIQESKLDNNNTTKELVNSSPRINSHHQSINMANLEIPVTESNDNVEKAEAYTKELENICNILKKKHEEVKELLVRAVVNNNKLLMLNHPLYENKIRMVQEFAAKLTLKDQHMMQT